MKQPAIVRAGLDVGARELVVALRRDEVLEPTITLANTPAGHRQLLKLLTRRGASARVCLEATGVYSLRLALALHRAERVEVMVVNPRAIIMPALVAIQRSPQIKATYEALLARGKKKKVALIAIMRRMLHAIWGMLHHQQDFNPQLFHASPLPNS